MKLIEEIDKKYKISIKEKDRFVYVRLVRTQLD